MDNQIGVDIAGKIGQLTADGAWRPALDLLMAENRKQPSASLERELIDMRIRAFRDLNWPVPAISWPPPYAVLPTSGDSLPEIESEALCVDTLRSGILGNGALIVRGLMDEATAARMRDNIDRTVSARHAGAGGEDIEKQIWYRRSSMVKGGPAQFFGRGAEDRFTTASVWAVDSPRTADQLVHFYHSIKLPELLQGYFSEPATLSVRKWVLRRVAPDNGSQAGWHQDGRFLGSGIRTVNLWIALSDCGGGAPAPGMEIIAGGTKDIYETGTQGASFDWTVGQGLVDEISKNSPVLCPRFRPGDALFFDHHNLHRTGFGTDHTQLRYALESWFFAASTAPEKQMPLVF